MTAASCRLGATESEMAIAQQFVDRVATQWICGRADTDRDAVLTRPGQQRRVECKADAFAELRDGFGHIGARYRDGKFIAAQARHRSRATGLGVQSSGHG